MENALYKYLFYFIIIITTGNQKQFIGQFLPVLVQEKGSTLVYTPCDNKSIEVKKDCTGSLISQGWISEPKEDT